MQQRLNWKWREESKIPKYWSYKIGQRARVNFKAEYFYPGITNKEGRIIEYLEQGVLDYGFEDDDKNLYRLKEDEVEIIPDEVGESMKNKIIICSNIAGAGKDTVRLFLEEKYGYAGLSFAEPIYDIAIEYFDMKSKDRQILQRTGEAMRSVKESVWVDYAFKKVREMEERNYRVFCISDMRRENEYIRAIEEGFFPIRVVCDRDVAIQRIIERDGHCDVNLLDNESESGTRHIAMTEIYNNGSFEDLYKQIDEVVFG
jgi:hypothetical protein